MFDHLNLRPIYQLLLALDLDYRLARKGHKSIDAQPNESFTLIVFYISYDIKHVPVASLVSHTDNISRWFNGGPAFDLL